MNIPYFHLFQKIISSLNRRKRLLYIEIEDQSISLSLLSMNNKKFLLKTKQLIPLQKTMVRSGIIYNPTIIKNIIENFIKQHHLLKPKTIACIPDLNNKKALALPLSTLQIALCLSKAKIEILSIIPTPLQFHTNHKKKENFVFIKEAIFQQKDFLAPFKKIPSPFPFLKIGLAGTITTILLLLLLNFYTKNNNNLAILRQENLSLQSKKKNLKEKVLELQHTQENISLSSTKIQELTNVKDFHYNPSKLIIEIATKIPPNCHLTNLEITRNTKRKNPLETKENFTKKSFHNPQKKYKKIFIQGLSSSLLSVNNFLYSLQESKKIHKLSLVQVSKITPKKRRKPKKKRKRKNTNLKSKKKRKRRRKNIKESYSFEFTGKILVPTEKYGIT
jgi:Tfp pilus assembly protein PilN